jgi:hypothetical protein
MARPKTKTVDATLKMTPEVRVLWEQCAAAEVRALTNKFEVMVRAYGARLPTPSRAVRRSARKKTMSRKEPR